MKKSMKDNKAGYMIALFGLIAALSILLFNWLLKSIMLHLFSPDYFVLIKSQASVFYTFFPFAIILMFLTALYYYPERKIAKWKYIVISICTLLVTLSLTIVILLNCNILSFNSNEFISCKLFSKNQIVYTYDDIESVDIQIEINSDRMLTGNLLYTFEMNDGKQIEFDVLDSFRNNDDKLIEFDKSLSEKRNTIGNFSYISNLNSEINNYYRQLFNSINE